MDTVYSVLAALAAAMSFASAAVLQQEATQSIAEMETLRIHLLLSLLRRPKWVAGSTMLLVGYGLQALALAFGPVALVQPIVVTELAFAIPLAMWRRQRRARTKEWVGIVLVLVGVATFLLVADPAEGTASPALSTWVLSLTPVGGMIAVAVAVAIKRRGRRRAMWLGAAAGLAFSLLAVLTKSVTYQLGHDLAATFASWQLYAVVSLGIVALVISQSAYQAGPLAFSMPFIGVLEPLVAVIIGDTALDEEIQMSARFFAIEAIAAGTACIGIVMLTTSPVVLSIYEDSLRSRERETENSP